MSTKKRTSPTDHHNHEMIERLKVIKSKEKLSDVTLISGVDGKRIPTHRLILAIASDYFDSMFFSAMKEATEKEITINDIDGKTLQSLVTYCYTGELNLQEDNVEKILSSAHQLQFPIVVDKCAKFMKSQLNSSNCLGIKFFAEQFNCTELETKAQTYICENFEQVAKSEEFFQLNADQLDELLARDDLNVELEEDIFLSLMSWVQSDETNRKKDIPKLLLNVRIPLMDSKFIIDNVKSVCEDNGCSDLYIEAYGWKLSPNDFPEINSKSIEPRIFAGCLLAHYDGEFEKYCPKLNQWMAMKEMSIEEEFFDAAVWKEKLVIVGGWKNHCFLNSVKYWDVNLKSWKELRPLNSARDSVALAVLGDSLYAIGGETTHGQAKNVERLDSLTGAWQNVASMPIELTHVEAAVYDGFIYVAGIVFIGSDVNGQLLRYDPQLDKWTDLGVTTTNPRSLLVIKGDLYGFRYDEIKKYNKSLNTWTTYANNCPYFQVSCAYNNRIFIVAKKDENEDEEDNEDEGDEYEKEGNILLLKEYKLETNSWVNLAPLITQDLRKCIYVPHSVICIL